MGSNRITQLHVYVIGLVIMLIVGGGLFFFMLKPVYAQVQVAKTDLQGQETTSVQVGKKQFTYQIGPTGEKAVADAKLAVKDTQAESAHTLLELKQLESSKQSPIPINIGDGTDQYILQNTMRNWLNLPRAVVPKMKDFATRLGAKHGV